MRTPARSDVGWFAAACLVLLIGRRKHGKHPGPGKHTGPGKHDEPGSHHIPRVLSLTQLRELATAVGMADPITGAAIAMAESSGNTRAVGDKGNSIGLWQINIRYCPKQYANRDMLKEAGFNAQAALAMSNGGTNWQPWAAYTSGRYKRYLTP